MPDSRSKIPVVAAVVAGVLLVAGVRSLTTGSHKGSPKPGASADGCTSFTLAASSEKAALLSQVGREYNDDKHSVGGTCVHVEVVTKSSGGAAEALGRGWDETLDGPRPDVWSPASSTWAVLLRQRLASKDQPDIVPGDKPSDLPNIAQTPLTIAMPRPMAQALGWPAKSLGFADLLALIRDKSGWGHYGHPEWGAFRLGKTNPNYSTSGLNATIGAYFAATGLSSDLTAANVKDPKTVAYVKGVESGVVHYGDTTLTFLANLQRADDAGRGLSYISAVTVEEKSVWDYNEGNPSGDPVTHGKHAKPRVPLVAVYPKEGTLFSDNPYIVLNASWVTDAQRAAAADFLKYLQADNQQKRFQAAAFRDFRGRPGSLISRDNGMLPDQPKLRLSPPAPAVLDLVQRSWNDVRKRARILFVIDVSGSMGEAVPKSGGSKLDLAKHAAANALTTFALDDEVGLWVFSTPQSTGEPPYRELVPIGPIRQDIRQLRDRVNGLVPQGGTALYATARAAVASVKQSFNPDRINAVVFLTDGKNEYPADVDLDGLVRSLTSEDESTAVRLFTIAYGDDADLPTLRRIAEASRAAAYDASDPASIDKVLAAVISNF